ncbi:MAG: UbiA family prenyltransferase [Candidatus Aminicenantes bacterium]|nr:UbiA family prenyltransferase [Candidatus Aminicenantes bacterium]
MKFISYLNLSRPGIFVGAFFSYMIGAGIAGGFDLYNVFIAALVSLISTNFVYTFNSWADRDLDKIEKPDRPIPSGKISPKAAFNYSMFLLVLSVVYPFFFFNSPITLSHFMLFPFLGIIYSAEPIRLRNYPLAAVLVIVIGMQTPIRLGYYMNSSDNLLHPFFIIIFFMALFIIPLKATEEAELDKKINASNLYLKYGKKLLRFSLAGLVPCAAMAYLLDFDYRFKIFLFVFIPIVAVIISYYLFNSKNVHRLYESLKRTVAGVGILLIITLKIFKII